MRTLKAAGRLAPQLLPLEDGSSVPKSGRLKVNHDQQESRHCPYRRSHLAGRRMPRHLLLSFSRGC